LDIPQTGCQIQGHIAACALLTGAAAVKAAAPIKAAKPVTMALEICIVETPLLMRKKRPDGLSAMKS
jgi:hypothetical protein